MIVEFEQRDLARYGEKAEEMRDGHESGRGELFAGYEFRQGPAELIAARAE